MSDSITEYHIPHAGLKKEIHEFTYELTEKFFSNIEGAQIEKCAIQVNITFDKRQEPYHIEIDLDGTIWNECDKCTAQIPLSIHASYIVYAKFTTDATLTETDNEEIIYIARDDQYIDISQLLYDYIHVAIPVHRICDNPGKTEYCDQEIIQLLDKQNEENNIDPRWADLDKLKDKLN
ncbi:MAG TPA: DUF177 domain-containing protein [Chitinophagales bacterium]|jgi:uncharacterized protein|nr:DUF177 domain-containing protein [Chitinophagales bacterium]MBP6154866.1 DUF177 domain-containing protein [Chitinophagales bacterium]HQV78361.1 DUF177 domain-containing protein [Chitinophagales bacterium]HQW79512.1 DUF177 domain-containing protein [Chitinophagales bacterium]HRB19142.1 DUF177 domain-containing protein [Chitinophagales bacterium]